MTTPATDLNGAPERKAPERKRTAAEHPLASWALENGCIVTLAWLRVRMAPDWLVRKWRTSFVKSTLLAMAGGLLVVDGGIVMQHFLVHFPKQMSLWMHVENRLMKPKSRPRKSLTKQI